MEKIPFNEIFGMQDGRLVPKMTVRIGKMLYGPGTRLDPKVLFKVTGTSEHANKLQVEKEGTVCKILGQE